MAHAKSSPTAKCRIRNNSPEAQNVAVGSEIAALRIAIKHIHQYGLESDYSPNALASRIKQLEATQASLRRKIPAPSGQMQKQGKSGRCWRKRNRKTQLAQALRNEGSSIFLNPQMAVPRQGSNSTSPSPATPKHQVMSQTETGGSSNPWVPESVPMHLHVGPHERSRTNLCMNDGGLRVAQFATSQL